MAVRVERHRADRAELFAFIKRSRILMRPWGPCRHQILRVVIERLTASSSLHGVQLPNCSACRTSRGTHSSPRPPQKRSAPSPDQQYRPPAYRTRAPPAPDCAGASRPHRAHGEVAATHHAGVEFMALVGGIDRAFSGR